jgi:hypothetical protein
MRMISVLYGIEAQLKYTSSTFSVQIAVHFQHSGRTAASAL